MILLILNVCLAAVLYQPTVQASDSSASLMTTNVNQQNEIVNKHNDLRRRVQPSAKNMLKMNWNNVIAQNAQRWANQCNLKHSSQQSRLIDGTGCGENLYMSSAPNSWSDAIQAWYNEVKDFAYGSGAKTRGAVIGHYTQVVWYKSNEVGCALAYCSAQPIFKYFYVCQYCPAGNYADKMATPYSTGQPCGDCPNNCNNGLCTNPCKENDKYTNCADLKNQWGCGKPIMQDCKASCTCTTEIQ
ncbi:cysteine-rich venom protein helothermine-like [Rhineura floridana]|uniref:cysteine-rich venom protein helothermine-like n=1 Tax=Rhineura floridana TaxID=261503 RepID=UPI002AC86FBC|nr:cysteine-rich venom protein helothermine-like [Rhineura floridana]